METIIWGLPLSKLLEICSQLIIQGAAKQCYAVTKADFIYYYDQFIANFN